MRKLALAALALSLAASGAYAINEITRSVIGSGGTGATGPTHRLQSTLGQSIAGKADGSVHTIWSGFWGRGGVPADVGDQEATLPLAFRLYANSPNPFGVETALRYDVPRAGGRVRVRVFNVEGRLVRSLVDRIEAPGRKSIVWNGCDAEGRPLSQGIYLCTLDAPGYSKTQKLVLTR